MLSLSKSLLKNLNLSPAQAQVYFAALELGQATMQELARKSGIKRTSIYNFINELKERHLLAETQKKKRSVYSAVNPEVLVEMEKARLRELENLTPELLAIFNQSRKKPRVTFYEGVAGINEVYTDTLKEKKPIVAWTDYEHMKTVMGDRFIDEYPQERVKRRISFKAIVRDGPIAREMEKKNIEHLRQIKFIQGDLKTEINIYGNKVAFMSFRSAPPFAVIIEDIGIAETMRAGWEQLWERL